MVVAPPPPSATYHYAQAAQLHKQAQKFIHVVNND